MTRAAHIHRRGPRVVNQQLTPEPARPPGWFTEPVRAWLGPFGPMWRPAIDWKAQPNSATDNRQRGLDAGAAWATGTVHGIGAIKGSVAAAGWMR